MVTLICGIQKQNHKISYIQKRDPFVPEVAGRSMDWEKWMKCIKSLKNDKDDNK